jgi:hypothetical protein
MKPEIKEQLRLHTLMLRASEGRLSASEQQALEDLLLNEAHRQMYLEFISMSSCLGSSTPNMDVAQMTRPATRRRWALGAAAVAAAVVLVVVLLLGHSPVSSPGPIPGSEIGVSTVFMDEQYNNRIHYIQERLKGSDTSRRYLKKRSSPEAIRDRIQELEREPIFTKENKNAQQSVIRIGSRWIIARGCAPGHERVTG